MVKQIDELMFDRSAAGLCQKCGKVPKLEGRLYCIDCRRRGTLAYAKRKLRIVNAYGGQVCVGCGETELEVLQIDHINGGGNRHAKEIGGYGNLYRWLIQNNFPPGFRVLCANCNIRALRKKPFPQPVELFQQSEEGMTDF